MENGVWFCIGWRITAVFDLDLFTFGTFIVWFCIGFISSPKICFLVLHGCGPAALCTDFHNICKRTNAYSIWFDQFSPTFTAILAIDSIFLTYLNVSWIFFFRSTAFSVVISCSKCPESRSTARSTSLWFSSKISTSLFFFKKYANTNV